MISIEEARKWTQDKSFPLSEELLPLEDAIGRVLAHDILTDIPQPSFRNSAMDGYAMLRSDLDSGLRTFKVAGEIQAGKSEVIRINQGETWRIFTGAVAPENCDMVVIQEKTDRGSAEVEVKQYDQGDGSNIREVGEQLKKGETALSAGHRINPASIGLLRSLGVSEVVVHRLPRIAVVTTGNELKEPGEELGLGEIFETNSITLKAAMSQHGFHIDTHIKVKDSLENTVEAIGKAIEEHDVLILSGGISVGDYDFVKEGLEKNGIEEVFYKVHQKPGKPMYFGVKAENLVYALPGNPASLLVCFNEYVLPSLRKLRGERGFLQPPMFKLKLKHDHFFKGPRPEFFRGRFKGDEVEVLTGQASFMLKSFAEANCLIYIHGDKRTLEAGSEVEVHPIF